MSILVFIRRSLYGLLIVAMLVITIGPWGLYWLGLYGIDGVPEPPRSIATEKEQTEIRRKARGKGSIEVKPISPHGYAWLIYKLDRDRADLRIAWQVASTYLRVNKKHDRTIWWHLSGAALTIWVTRNWNTERIISKAAEIERAKNG